MDRAALADGGRFVSGWIKFEKELINDPRVLRIASRLSHADVTQVSRNRLVVIGALVTLWSFADSHIRGDNTLDAGKDEIDAVVGVAGFCDLMPRDWLQVLDADRIELPGFLAHNGIEAKKKALAQKRQQNHRRNDNAQVTPASRSRNARPSTNALPDRDQDQDLNQEKKIQNPSAHRTAPSDEQFLDFKLIYPNRSGDQGWRKALRAAHARISEGHPWEEILEGARRYAAYIRSTGNQDSTFVKQAATFLGPDLFFQQPWDPPKSKAENHRDVNIENSQEWLHAS